MAAMIEEIIVGTAWKPRDGKRKNVFSVVHDVSEYAVTFTTVYSAEHAEVHTQLKRIFLKFYVPIFITI